MIDDEIASCCVFHTCYCCSWRSEEKLGVGCVYVPAVLGSRSEENLEVVCVCVGVCAGAGISLQQLQQQTTTNNDNKKKESYSPSDDNRKRIAKERSRNVQEDLMTGGGARKKECCCALGCATEGKGRRVAHAINVPRTCLVLVGPPSTVRRLWIPPNPPFSSSSSSYAWSRKEGTPKT